MRFNPFEKHSSPQSSPQHIYNAALALLFNRCFTATLSICLLGLTAYYVPVEKRTDFGVLTGLRFYIACTIISTLGTLYGLFHSLPLLRDQSSRTGQTQAFARILSKRWTLLGIDSILLVLWIVAAVIGKGSAPHFTSNGTSLSAFAIVMAIFEGWAIGIVLLSRGFREL